MDAAAGAAGGDGKQAFGGGVAEGGGKSGDHQEPVFFGDRAGLFVVFGDGRVLVAQIHLDDLFDVLVEFGEAFLDLGALGPDPVMDQGFLVIREVHQPGEILAEPDRIDEHERRPAGRCEANRRSAIAWSTRVAAPASAPSLSIKIEPWSGNPSANGTVRCPPAGTAKRESAGMPPASAATSTSMRPIRTADGASAGGSQAAQTSGVHAGNVRPRCFIQRRQVARTTATRPGAMFPQGIERLVGFRLDGGFDDVLAGLERPGPRVGFLAGLADRQFVGGSELIQFAAVESL